jgi:tRNA threonylcarbamoyladenosine biosynthesis protein TsaE
MPDPTSELIVQSRSPEDTLRIGQIIGGATESNTVITLTGNLGAGKTWLAKGIAYGLGVPDYEYVNSPAYDLVHEYKGKLTIYHLDLYRLDTLSTDDLLMIQEFYGNGGLCLIEWPSRLEKYTGAYPKHYLAIHIEASNPDDENERTLRFSAQDEQHSAILERITRNLNP